MSANSHTRLSPNFRQSRPSKKGNGRSGKCGHRLGKHSKFRSGGQKPSAASNERNASREREKGDRSRTRRGEGEGSTAGRVRIRVRASTRASIRKGRGSNPSCGEVACVRYETAGFGGVRLVVFRSRSLANWLDRREGTAEGTHRRQAGTELRGRFATAQSRGKMVGGEIKKAGSSMRRRQKRSGSTEQANVESEILHRSSSSSHFKNRRPQCRAHECRSSNCFHDASMIRPRCVTDEKRGKTPSLCASCGHFQQHARSHNWRVRASPFS